METILNREVIADIFKEFPQLNRMWVKGDLETFYNAEIIIEDCVNDGDLIHFIYKHFDFEKPEFGPSVYPESFMRDNQYLDETHVECKRDDYV